MPSIQIVYQEPCGILLDRQKDALLLSKPQLGWGGAAREASFGDTMANSPDS